MQRRKTYEASKNHLYYNYCNFPFINNIYVCYYEFGFKKFKS